MTYKYHAVHGTVKIVSHHSDARVIISVKGEKWAVSMDTLHPLALELGKQYAHQGLIATPFKIDDDGVHVVHADGGRAIIPHGVELPLYDHHKDVVQGQALVLGLTRGDVATLYGERAYDLSDADLLVLADMVAEGISDDEFALSLESALDVWKS